MQEHEKILKLIEGVNPDDGAALDDIDRRVWAYLNLNDDYNISFHRDSAAITYRHKSWPDHAQSILHHKFQHPRYTRRRDTLKAIRHDQWWVHILSFPSHREAVCVLSIPPVCKTKIKLSSPHLQTEELAELHAIIQAIHFERTNQ